jgi:hypothetical protein
MNVLDLWRVRPLAVKLWQSGPGEVRAIVCGISGMRKELGPQEKGLRNNLQPTVLACNLSTCQHIEAHVVKHESKSLVKNAHTIMVTMTKSKW